MILPTVQCHYETSLEEYMSRLGGGENESEINGAGIPRNIFPCVIMGKGFLAIRW